MHCVTAQYQKQLRFFGQTPERRSQVLVGLQRFGHDKGVSGLGIN